MIDLHLGKSENVLRLMPASSVDSVVTDAPYHLSSIVERFGKSDAAPNQFGKDGAYARASRGFMGQQWDGGDIAFRPEFWKEVLRVLKPGGYLLCFGGSRTYHRMACAIEDAGFEIRDQIMWIYGSGFPKSHNLNGEWEGWGSALKPAHEPIVMARKPLSGTMEENVRVWRTGALNIDGCRVEYETVNNGNLADNPHLRSHINGGNGGKIISHEKERRVVVPDELGRWPANIIHDGSEEVLVAFPDAVGAQGVVTGNEPTTNGFSGAVKFSGMIGRIRGADPRGDSGSAARFFYCPKASRKDRNEGLPDPGSQFTHGTTLRKVEDAEKSGNTHPTVKPTELMRYLCRLVTPPGGLVLDPFMGSGSTGKAAMLEGFRFIGIDMTEEYFDIAKLRIEFVAQGLTGTYHRHPMDEKETPPDGQMALL